MATKQAYKGIDKNAIENIINRYSYEQTSIMDTAQTIYFSVTRNEIIFPQFYRYNKQSKRGTCFELMHASAYEVQRKFPNYHIYKISGHEPKFFQEHNGTHGYFLLSSKKLFKDNLEELEKITILREVNPLLVDTTYKLIKPFKETTHIIKHIINNKEFNYKKEGILNEKRAKPLLITKNNQLVTITGDLRAKKKLRIDVINENNTLEMTGDVCDKYWREQGLGDKRLRQIARYINNMPFKHIR